jgi:hypothetical protein
MRVTAARADPTPRPALRLVSTAGEQPRNGNVLVQLVPVQSPVADRDGEALLAGRVQQAREPGEGNAEGAPVRQLDPEAVVVEADGTSRCSRQALQISSARFWTICSISRKARASKRELCARLTGARLTGARSPSFEQKKNL